MSPCGFAFVCLVFGGRRNVELGEVRHANVDDILRVIQIKLFLFFKKVWEPIAHLVHLSPTVALLPDEPSRPRHPPPLLKVGRQVAVRDAGVVVAL